MISISLNFNCEGTCFCLGDSQSSTEYPQIVWSIHLSLVILTHSLKCKAVFPAMKLSFVFDNSSEPLLTLNFSFDCFLHQVLSCKTADDADCLCCKFSLVDL